MEYLKIGQLSSALGISNDTIRLYEKYGLLDKPLRFPNGYRQYSEDDFYRLEFIIKAKTIGFTLTEISELLNIKNYHSNHCHMIKEKVKQKLYSAREKIIQLQQLEVDLQSLIDNCDATHSEKNCPIVFYFQSANKI